jgi:hypothetical protein
MAEDQSMRPATGTIRVYPAGHPEQARDFPVDQLPLEFVEAYNNHKPEHWPVASAGSDQPNRSTDYLVDNEIIDPEWVDKKLAESIEWLNDFIKEHEAKPPAVTYAQIQSETAHTVIGAPTGDAIVKEWSGAPGWLPDEPKPIRFREFL